MSQYLRRIPASRAHRQYCYYCNELTQDIRIIQASCSRTRDHILSRCHGKYPTFKMTAGITNIRSCCSDCNNFRAYLGHCVGVLMMTIIEGVHRGTDKREAAHALGLNVYYNQPNCKMRRQAKRRARRESQLDHGIAVS
jgi:hypothetical protein